MRRLRPVDLALGIADQTLHEVAVAGIDQIALGIDVEVSGARVEPLPGGQLIGQGEEAVAFDRQIESPARGLKSALGEHGVHRANPRAQTDLHRIRAARRSLAAGGGANRLTEDVLKSHPARLKADRIDVADVVPDHVDSGLMVPQSRDRGKHGS